MQRQVAKPSHQLRLRPGACLAKDSLEQKPHRIGADAVFEGVSLHRVALRQTRGAPCVVRRAASTAISAPSGPTSLNAALAGGWLAASAASCACALPSRNLN